MFEISFSITIIVLLLCICNNIIDYCIVVDFEKELKMVITSYKEAVEFCEKVEFVKLNNKITEESLKEKEKIRLELIDELKKKASFLYKESKKAKKAIFFDSSSQIKTYNTFSELEQIDKYLASFKF